MSCQYVLSIVQKNQGKHSYSLLGFTRTLLVLYCQPKFLLLQIFDFSDIIEVDIT